MVASQADTRSAAPERRADRGDAPADLWPVLDGGFRSAARDAGAAAARRVFDGIPGSKLPWIPVRPFFMDLEHYREFARITSRLGRLVLAACLRRAVTAGDLLDALEMSGADLPLLDRSAPLSQDLLISLRPDAVYHDGVPKYLELNIDGAVGGAPQVDLVSSRFMQEYARAADEAGHGFRLLAARSSVEARFAALSRWHTGQPGRRVVIPVFSVGAAPGLEDDPGRFIAWLAPWCEAGRRHGLDTAAFPLDELRLSAAGKLQAGPAPVDVVLRLFLLARQPPSEGTSALAQAVRAGTVAMHTPEATCLLMNKRTLAWLWADLGLLGETDQQLVTRHIPHTVYLPAGTEPADPLLRDARLGRPGLVLKPAHGYSGKGVIIGPAVSQADWEAALGVAAAQGGHVLQDYVEPDTTPMEFVHQVTGDVCSADVPFVAGPFMFGGRPSGLLVRHGGPDGGSVLNAHYGAAVNAALLVSRRC